MAISEENRHQLHNKLDEVLGSSEAATLMSHLPPIGWADVATKHDLVELERRLDLRFDQVYARFGEGDRHLEHIERRFDNLDERMQTGFAQVNRRFDEMFREFRSLLVSVMSVMAVLFATMAGAIIAAIKI